MFVYRECNAPIAFTVFYVNTMGNPFGGLKVIKFIRLHGRILAIFKQVFIGLKAPKEELYSYNYAKKLKFIIKECLF